jgi:hypothetical protein
VLLVPVGDPGAHGAGDLDLSAALQAEARFGFIDLFGVNLSARLNTEILHSNKH